MQAGRRTGAHLAAAANSRRAWHGPWPAALFPLSLSSVQKYPRGSGGLAPRLQHQMPAPASKRIAALDIARTAALAGMFAFHFRYDLVMFGLLPPEVTGSFLFYWHARLVAGSFLFLAGLSLWLGHGHAIRWPAFWHREIKLVSAAALVSAGTFLALPESWVFFGILHAIALCSLLALPFLRSPAPLTLAVGLAFMAASFYLPDWAQWNHPALRWIGLQTQPTLTVDLEPLFPWFGPFLLGLGTGQLLGTFWPRLQPPQTRLSGALAWPGQHSLAIYLIHQPVLLGLIWTYLQLR